MFTKHLALVALVAVAIGVVGCYPKSAPPPGAPSANAVTWATARWPNVTADSLAQGRGFFVAKCNGCHDYPDLSAIDEGSWPKIVKRMGDKAHLTPDQSDMVLHFVLASRSEQQAR